MFASTISRRSWPIAAALGMMMSFGLAGSLGSAEARSPAKPADLNPAAITITPPDQIKWTGRPGVSENAVLLGDPSKPGLYIQLVKWYPHNMSHPHFHPNDRYVYVLSGTWWVGTGPKYDPDSTVAVHAGSYVVHTAKQIHYDGAKDEIAVLEIVGEGPATATPAEEK
jgi:quercetin dioxygenase-like cupin family protein